MVPDANLYITLSKEIGCQFLTKDRSFLAFGRHVIIHCRYLVGTLVRGCRCAMSWSDLDLTFDLAIVTLTYKILSGLYLGNSKVQNCRKLILGRDIGRGL